MESFQQPRKLDYTHRMPIAMNNDVAVRYEVAGDVTKPPLVLIFGFSMTCEDWVDLGYVDRLREVFRVVCVEPRGHGRSTSPVDPSAYSLTAMAADVEAVIAALDLERPILWGYSLGAKIALATAAKSADRYSGLVLGGFELHSQVDQVDDVVADRLAEGPHAWLSLWQQMFDVPGGLARRLAAVDTRALSALRQAEAAWPSLAPAVERIACPVLLYAGETCFFGASTRQANTDISDATYIEYPDRNHFEMMLESEWITGAVVGKFRQQ